MLLQFYKTPSKHSKSNIYLSDETYQKLKKLAKAEHISASHALDKVIKFGERFNENTINSNENA